MPAPRRGLSAEPVYTAFNWLTGPTAHAGWLRGSLAIWPSIHKGIIQRRQRRRCIDGIDDRTIHPPQAPISLPLRPIPTLLTFLSFPSRLLTSRPHSLRSFLNCCAHATNPPSLTSPIHSIHPAQTTPNIALNQSTTISKTQLHNHLCLPYLMRSSRSARHGAAAPYPAELISANYRSAINK